MIIKKLDKNLLWNYIGYGISLGVNVLLLPLVLKFLSEQELGLWYVFVTIGMFVSMVDFGFSPQIARFITYAYAGAISLEKNNVAVSTNRNANIPLLHKLLFVSHRLYLYLSLLVLSILSTLGTYYIYSISESLSIKEVLFSWGIFCIASFINILYCYYSAFFRGIGDFVSYNKALLLSKIIQILFSFMGLWSGLGLIAVAFSFFLAGISFRLYLSFQLGSFKKKHLFPNKKGEFDKNILGVLWHNSWREGLVMLSRYLIVQSSTLLCSLYIDLKETASYALSVQILTGGLDLIK